MNKAVKLTLESGSVRITRGMTLANIAWLSLIG